MTGTGHSESTTATPQHYDLIIIGTGSGNSIPGPEFDDQRIAIVEKGTFGGTCLNVGCIPTKMYVHTADVASEIRDASRFGIDASYNGIDWPSLVERVFARRVDPIAAGGEAYRRGPETPNIDVFDMHARFTDDHTIVTGRGDEQVTITGDQIVIAAGSRPFVPAVILQSGVRYYTNENIMRMPELPQTMVIVGGGYIALEFAHVFESLGVNVSIINRSGHLLRETDADISARITELAAQRYDLHCGHVVADAAENPDGTITLTLEDESTVDADVLLIATGRTPNGDLMDLHRSGIEMEEGRIKVDDYGRTTAPGIWALGDVSSPFQLKHVANAEMRAVRHNLLNPDNLTPLPHDYVPSAVFTYPQIAQVGMTEKEAVDSGHSITVKVQNYSDVAYGWALEDTTGFAKLIADKDSGMLLGAHIIGPQASTLIQQLITVISFGLDVRDVATKQYWIHPALPEVIENALLGLEF